jgi:hypothetical protein
MTWRELINCTAYDREGARAPSAIMTSTAFSFAPTQPQRIHLWSQE